MDCKSLPIANLPFLSKLIKDYLLSNEQLKNFIPYPPTFESIPEVMKQRQLKPIQRQVLVEALTEQYQLVTIQHNILKNIELLAQDTTFTVTTAHQPNILTGPNFFIIKIIETIGLCQRLKEKFPDNHFVPIFYMGCEDADIDELNNLTIFDKKLVWKTLQTGAVGRMRVDELLIKLIETYTQTIATTDEGKYLCNLMKSCYSLGETIQQANFKLVHELLGYLGIVVLIPDNAKLKRLFLPLIRAELEHLDSHRIVQETMTEFKYPIPTTGNDVNLFYLKEDQRLKINRIGAQFKIKNHPELYSLEQLLNLFESEPETISPNVVLRPLFQETILPNVIFVGGGGEMSYWLFLRNVFKHYQMPMPILKLRNSFGFIKEKHYFHWDKAGFSLQDLFLEEQNLIEIYLQKKYGELENFESIIEKQLHLGDMLQEKIQYYDSGLEEHINSLVHSWHQDIYKLEKKIKV